MSVTMRTTILGRALLLVLHVTLGSCQSEDNFIMYDKNMNKCLRGYQPLKLFHCDSNQPSQQFRWTSEDRIFNVYLKKCLGAGSRADGSGLQWFTCDDKSDLQKWECKNNTKLNLKGTDLFVSQEENTVLRLTQDNSTASQWLIHGTEEGLCSRPYREIYTVQGNAFGSPCHFPFLYQGQWYSDCKLEEPTQRYWCSVDRDYNDKWGYCPTTRSQPLESEGWKKNPLMGVYYQVNVNSALTWHQARMSCQQQDSDLLSITEPQEQTFISGITNEFQTSLWIGLNQLNSESGWQWVDGNPFSYLRWGSGQPNPAPGWSCASLITAQNYEWQNKLCSRRHGYICQKRTTISATATPAPPVACNAPWISYAGHCYFLNRTKNTWKDANAQCIDGGGHLASIHNIEEQSFFLSQLGYRETDKLWIGLNDKKTQLLFEWSDHSRVMFTAWDVQEPSHHRSEEEDCVLMGGKDGKWGDASCEEQNGFICKKAGDSASSSAMEHNNIGCKAGWTRHGYNCYFVGPTTKTFDEAKDSCQDSGAHLVDVPDRLENAFLISMVGARPEKHFWIGLNNQRNLSVFEWTNTPKVPYTHWNARMPGQKQGCVAMATGTLAGLWDVLSCSNKEKYICRHQAEGVVTTPAPTTSPAPRCAVGWSPLGDRPFCFKFFDMPSREQRSWSEALEYCRSIGGDLMSVHSDAEGQLRTRARIPPFYPWYRELDHWHGEPDPWHMPPRHWLQREGWIGYSAQDPTVGYTWSDGSSSSFTNWNWGEPNNLHNMENCAEIVRNMKWNDAPCVKKNDFYCEIHKGRTPNEPNANLTQYNVTEDGWVRFNGHQYFLNSQRRHEMEEAQTSCQKKHGDLVVIDSEEEWTFLHTQMQVQVNRDVSYYIGLKVDLEKNAQWMDQTPVIFTKWRTDQPQFHAYDETCVTMDAGYGTWTNINCGAERGYICERDEGHPVNSTAAPAPTEAPKPGGCASEWTQFNQYCYKPHPDERNWTDAKTICNKLNGHLVSIRNSEEQAFVTTMMANYSQNMWIGLREATGFQWTEGKRVTYRNFVNGRMAMYAASIRSCIAMEGKQRKNVGKWVFTPCSTALGFICKRPTDTTIPPQPSIPQSYVSFRNDSLKVLPSNLTWFEAQKACEEDQAHLVSIRDAVTQAFIQLQAHELKQPIWIGLNKNLTDGYFTWIDQWHLNMENWVHWSSSSSFPCVYVDLNGKWNPAPCNLSLPSVCKRSTDTPPVTITQYPGICPNSWVPFRNYCYKLGTDRDYWSTALTECLGLGASLLSIEDTEEADFIKTILEYVEDTYDLIWIGLFKTNKDQWHWIDRSILSYINWGEDQPSSDGYAAMSTSDLTWRTKPKYRNLGYICKKAKEPRPTVAVPETVASKVYRVHTGVIAAFIITLGTVTGFIAFFYYRGYKPSLPTLTSFGNHLYFNSTESDISEKVSVVQSMEIDSCSLEKDNLADDKDI